MKKSGGSPSRVHYNDPPAPVRQEPGRAEKEPARWKWHLAVGGGIIILILLILPCQLRRCGGARDHGGPAYRRIMSSVAAVTAGKKRPEHSMTLEPASRKLHTLKPAEQRRKTAADNRYAGEPDREKKEGGLKPPEKDRQQGKIETADRNASKQNDRSGQAEKRTRDEKNQVKRNERPAVPNFGTKLEVIPAPERN